MLISEKTRQLAAQAEQLIAPVFASIDAVAQKNTEKVLAAFQDHRVSAVMFDGTTGYGYDDRGRDTLDQIYAQVFGAEDALVRIQFVNGTHTLACALFGMLRPGDTLVSLVKRCRGCSGHFSADDALCAKKVFSHRERLCLKRGGNMCFPQKMGSETDRMLKF